jgi:hypothetical protein
MSRRRLATAIALAVLLIVIILIATGVFEGTRALGDRAGDVAVSPGSNPPKEPAVADIVEVDVRPEGDSILFEVTLDAPFSELEEASSLSVVWDIQEEGIPTWIVNAEVTSSESHVAVVAERIDYAASTLDSRLPGGIDTSGATIEVRVRVAEIAGFPDTFEWTIESQLDGVVGDPASAVATDSAPAGEPARFSS